PRPRVPRYSRWPAEGEPHPPVLQRLFPHVAQVYRRPQPVHSAPSVPERGASPVRTWILEVRLDEHERGPGPVSADSEGQPDSATRERLADQGLLVDGGRRVRRG